MGPDFILVLYTWSTNLRPLETDKSNPDWNRWDPALPGHFFNISRSYLSDDGFLAIMHSTQFSHTSAIYAAVGARGLFKPVQSFIILLPKLMWQAKSNCEVGTLLEMFVLDGGKNCNYSVNVATEIWKNWIISLLFSVLC